jgi:hypothetical protein
VFHMHAHLALATRMDDHQCWAWKLADAGPSLAPGIRSVNRVSSHFLAYDVARVRRQSERLDGSTLYDDGRTWFNYEDWLSAKFAVPRGSGIGFLDRFPIRVFHCDRKRSVGSPFYTGDPAVKLGEFNRRKSEIAAESSGIRGARCGAPGQ